MLTPDMDSGSNRMLHLLHILKELFTRVSFIAHFPRSWPPFDIHLQKDAKQLSESGIEVVSGENASSVQEYLRSYAEDYDVIMLSDVYVASAQMDTVRKCAPRALVLFDTENLHYLRSYREARETGKVRLLQGALRTKKKELSTSRKADFTIVVSPVEKTILERDCPGVQVRVISNVHIPERVEVPFSNRKDLLFVGTLTSLQNIDALHYFLEEIFPLIRNRIPGIRVQIVGASPPDSIAALASEEIFLAGYVEDLTPYLSGCRLSIAPLRFGAGVKGKVLQSLSHGLPVVGSSMAVEGSYMTHGRDVLVADNVADFSEAVVSLYTDEDMWNRLSRNGLEVISNHFSPEAARKGFLEMFAEAGRSIKSEPAIG